MHVTDVNNIILINTIASRESPVKMKILLNLRRRNRTKAVLKAADGFSKSETSVLVTNSITRKPFSQRRSGLFRTLFILSKRQSLYERL